MVFESPPSPGNSNPFCGVCAYFLELHIIQCRMQHNNFAIFFTIYLVGLNKIFLCVPGKAISGYEHFGLCGKIFPQPQREPTVGETMIEEYRKANPKRTLRTKLCPRCHQKCLKENNNNNHLKCWACKTGFCYQCGKEIKGAVTLHFTAVSSCMQHSDD